MAIAMLLISMLAAAYALPHGEILHSMLQQHAIESNLTLTKFSWKDCGAQGNAMHVTSLTISPDPITIPGNLSVSIAASLSKVEAAPLKTTLVLKKGALKIPCIDDIGSCTYNDACTLLEKIKLKPDGTCPDPLPEYKIPCRCPLPAGSWNIPKLSFAIPKIKVPGWLTDGDYSVHAEIFEASGAQALCFDVEISLKA